MSELDDMEEFEIAPKHSRKASPKLMAYALKRGAQNMKEMADKPRDKPLWLRELRAQRWRSRKKEAAE